MFESGICRFVGIGVSGPDCGVWVGASRNFGGISLFRGLIWLGVIFLEFWLFWCFVSGFLVVRTWAGICDLRLCLLGLMFSGPGWFVWVV